MTQVTCPGLPGAWVNGWLAAVGATVLDARVQLHWTTDGAPLAMLSASEVDPVAALVESWPGRGPTVWPARSPNTGWAPAVSNGRCRWGRSLSEPELRGATRIPGRCRQR